MSTCTRNEYLQACCKCPNDRYPALTLTPSAMAASATGTGSSDSAVCTPSVMTRAKLEAPARSPFDAVNWTVRIASSASAVYVSAFMWLHSRKDNHDDKFTVYLYTEDSQYVLRIPM